MDIKKIEEIKEWFNSTDLDEIEFRDGDFRFSLAKKASFSGDVKINSNLVAVFSEDVGIFSFSKKGKTINIKKGDRVKKDAVLGYLNTSSKVIEIKSPVDGVIRLIAVDDEKVVEYGQLLFVIE